MGLGEEGRGLSPFRSLPAPGSGWIKQHGGRGMAQVTSDFECLSLKCACVLCPARGSGWGWPWRKGQAQKGGLTFEPLSSSPHSCLLLW